MFEDDQGELSLGSELGALELVAAGGTGALIAVVCAFGASPATLFALVLAAGALLLGVRRAGAPRAAAFDLRRAEERHQELERERRERELDLAVILAAKRRRRGLAA